MSPTILIAGATGLVGAEVVRKALRTAEVGSVIALVRRPLEVGHPKLVEWTATGGDLLTGLRDEPVDAVICCLGTTIRSVGGDRQKFIHVDKDLVVGLGRWAKRNGVGSFAVVSAIGADAGSRVFYNQVKGEMEEALRALDLPRLHIFQPSILTGPRREFRFGERIGIVAMKLFSPLMFGSLNVYKPMPSEVLAGALVDVALSNEDGPGVRVHTYRSIVDRARS